MGTERWGHEKGKGSTREKLLIQIHRDTGLTVRGFWAAIWVATVYSTLLKAFNLIFPMGQFASH